MDNPWEVDSIWHFSHFHCPECSFITKDDENFRIHALENHHLSLILFGNEHDEINNANEMIDDDDVNYEKLGDSGISAMNNKPSEILGRNDKALYLHIY